MPRTGSLAWAFAGRAGGLGLIMCSDQDTPDQTEAVEKSVLQQGNRHEAFATLSRFRGDFYDCLNGRADALLELTDALLCTDGPVRTLVDLALAPDTAVGTVSCTAA
ncbi:hypothetical protein QF034_008180 [Streptomyces africanus]|uniref:Uncharacterized protein n=1 Tax=Streptomyces africanus TaxID=231024 RepID=A0ABU0R2R4_9ACTN|nr:hypothetical protein [Streptomyces africanus]